MPPLQAYQEVLFMATTVINAAARLRQSLALVAKPLTTEQRDREPRSDFGLPDERKYPMPDKSHAGNAKARAKQQLDKGNLTRSEYDKIVRKADRILNKGK